MQYASLGTAGIKVSRIALGTWAMGDGRFWGPQEERVSIETILTALDSGVNFIDTAEAYGDGRSEEVVGRALRNRRDEAVIATKVVGDNLHPANLPGALDRSLRRLATDRVDVYYIHWPNPAVPLADTLGALERLREAGKVRAAAICNFGPRNLAALRALPPGGARPVAHQLPFNLLWRAIEGPILAETRAAGMPVIAYSALAQGLLAGQYRSIDAVPDHLRVTRFYRGDNGIASHGEPGAETEVFAAVGALAELGRENGLDMPQLALAWLLRNRDVASVLVGARSPDEVAENVAAADLEVAGSILDRADAVTMGVRDKLGDNADMWMGRAQSRFV